MQTAVVDALTINEAAETTGWSARMLRYIESIGLVEPGRSGSGYRLYGPAELQRLSTLRELLEEHGLENRTVSVVLPLGYSFNLDGSALYIGLATTFICEAYGLHLSFGRLLTILGAALLA